MVRNRLATRSMLLITRRPSATTWGSAEKLESSSTSWATPRVASLPDAIATPQSASFSARTSLTPSPVIATVWPRCCRARTIARFWCGVTRPNTVFSSSASASASRSSSPGRRLASMLRSHPASPARRATAPTVTGLSPEITFTVTPWSAKYSIVSAASARTTSSSSTRACAVDVGQLGRRRVAEVAVAVREQQDAAPGRGLLLDLLDCRSPDVGVAEHELRRAEHPAAVVGEGHRAPLARRGERHAAGLAPPVRRADPKCSFTASSVAFGSGSSSAIAASASSTSCSSAPSSGSTAASARLPSVIVPVLSAQSTSTRASTSMAGSSWTRQRCLLSRTTPTAKATLVSRTRPSGTIPTRPATVEMIASCQPWSLRKNWLEASSSPTGMIA